MQKKLAAALEKVKASSGHTVAMARKRYIVTAKCEELRSSTKQFGGFAKNKMARLETKIVKITHEQDA